MIEEKRNFAKKDYEMQTHATIALPRNIRLASRLEQNKKK